MSAEIAVAFPRGVFGRVLPALTGAALRPLQALLSTPQWIFLAALTAMLFRPPDLQGFPADRIAFAVLLVAVALRLCVQRQSLHYYPATWPALALTCLGLLSVLGQPYAPEAWSVLAAKWLVPSALFHISGYVFRDAGALRKLETFLLVVLVYLALVSVVFLLGATSWVFPRYILDEGIGIHADRARGPFLQAVANGVSLNLLGILALDGFRRGRVRGLLAAFLFLLVPLALLATKTRAVWASAALSIGYLLFFGPHRKLRRAAAAFCALALLSASAALVNEVNSGTLAERLEDRSPLAFRSEMYQAGWQMFLEKPLTGWGPDALIQPEIARRVRSFRPEYYIFHNTYLELAVQRGVLGLLLYVWLMVCFLRLSRPKNAPGITAEFPDRNFRRLWPLVLAIYLINASVVVMNYQFVNGLLFTFAGILSSQDRIAPGLKGS